MKIINLSNGSRIEVDSKGNKYYYLNNKRHREDGPAVELANGNKTWWINGKLHREDGPAVELFDGRKQWRIRGKVIQCTTQKEFETYLMLKTN